MSDQTQINGEEIPEGGAERLEAQEILSLMRDQLANSKQQSENIDKVADVVRDFAVVLRHKPSRRETFGIVGAINAVTLVVVAVMFAFVLSITSDARDGADDAKAVADQIQDCFDPNGRCAQVGRQTNEQNRLVISLRTNAFNLENDLALAKVDGASQARITALQTLLDQRRKEIATAEAQRPQL